MRDRLPALIPGDAQHAGLLLTRYAPEPDSEHPEKRSALLKGAIAARPAGELYTLAFKRRAASFPNDDLHLNRTLPTVNRLIVGLGTDNVLEAGIRLEHTYGVPIIPGSALKGLAAHHCHLCWGSDAAFARGGSVYSVLFGKTDDSGCIAFEDAWPLPESVAAGALRLDVMTPHHQKWQNKGAASPTDFDKPIPVSFLSVAGSFEVRVSWCGPALDDAPKWVAHAMAILVDALAERGAGGKTTSGYGRLAAATPAVPAARVTAPAPPQLRVNDSVEVKLTRRTGNGRGWFGIHEPTGLEGPITDTAAVLAARNQGDAARVWVHFVNRSSIQFKTAQPPPPRPQPANREGRR